MYRGRKNHRRYLGLDQIEYTGKAKKKDFLATLEHFEIMKTLTLGKYLSIRNYIEHENISPPSKEECLFFLNIFGAIFGIQGVFLITFLMKCPLTQKILKKAGSFLLMRLNARIMYPNHIYTSRLVFMTKALMLQADNSTRRELINELIKTSYIPIAQDETDVVLAKSLAFT